MSLLPVPPTHSSRVVDPHRFNTDPDPAFFLIADPDPGVPNPGLKIYSCKTFLDRKLQITYPWASIKDAQAMRVQEKPSALKREHPALQNNLKILYFFLYLWVIFALLDPDTDPATQINADPDPQP
jgi:hypothetical protein